MTELSSTLPDRTTPFDVMIVGGGPAGLSAALVLGRACRRVLLLDGGTYRNDPTRRVHGFLTRDGATPRALRAVARAQLAPYDVTCVDAKVTQIARRGTRFRARLADGHTVRARRVLLATGMRDHVPDFPGFQAIDGRSAHHCPYCDAWEWRGRSVAVYASTKGVDYALALTAWTSDVVLITHGRRAPRGDGAARLRRHGVRVETRPVTRLVSRRGALDAIELESGDPLARDALFFHLGMEQASELPGHLGCAFEGSGFVRVDASCRTSVTGVYAAGDLTPGPQSVVWAAAEGARAAAALHQDLRRSETR